MRGVTATGFAVEEVHKRRERDAESSALNGMFSCFCVKKIKNISDPFGLSDVSVKTNQYANRLLHLHDNPPPLSVRIPEPKISGRAPGCEAELKYWPKCVITAYNVKGATVKQIKCLILMSEFDPLCPITFVKSKRTT